jgi:methylenetetrahydrofolate reductase (NADPH)
MCVEMIQAIQAIKGVHGIHIMAYRQEERVSDIVKDSGALEGRVPWHPGMA